ncbi:HAD family hydrolase [Sediminibacillus massiliensis]|uniref:HAD family hydrolase n=1 Tax=Sediminibacillus massiliensis TaxID=1926277 RepID=UPI0009885C40|nr:HAD family hydrolase [Sediminibacillus massiliensis]
MKAIVFDFDGTIANTLPINFHGFHEVFKKYDGKDLSDEEIKEMFGPPEHELIEKNLESDQLDQAVALYYKEYEENHDKLVQKNEEINRMLSELKERGIKLGIVTGKSRKSFEMSLDKLDLKQYFDVLITGDDVTEDKPDPEGVEKALSKLGVRPEDAMYIGDSDADVEAGARAHTKTAAVKWLPEYQSSEYSTEPNVIFEQTDELFVYLKRNE